MTTANKRSGKTTVLLLSVLALLAGTALGQGKGKGSQTPVAVTLSTAPDSPGPQTVAPSDVNILVLGIDLAFAQAASGEVKKLAFTLEEMVGAPEGTLSGITSVSLFVNTTGLGWTDHGTTLVSTRPCDGAMANFPNLGISISTAMRFYLRIDGFDPAQAWDGRTYTFSIDAKAVHIHKKKDFDVTGSVMGSPLTISTKPAPPVITSPEDGATLTTTDVAVGGTAAPDSTVRVYEGTSLLGTGTASPTGTFQVLLTGLSQGEHSIFATAEKNGFTSDPSATVSFSIDAEGPTVASVIPEDTATDVHIHIHVVLTFSEPLDPATVVSSNISLSKAGTPVVGFIYYEPGSTQVTLSFEDGLDVETSYTVNITASLADVLGNPATPFQSTFTTGTMPPPAPVILLPVDGAIIEDTRTPTISGTADPGATVRIYDNATFITDITADPVTGAWSKTLVTDLEDGAYHFRARATGSLSDYSNTVTVEIRRDTDGDGLSDADEVNIYGTNPTDSDTDLDGLSDALEIEIGSNPLLGDSNNDGWSDGYAYSLGCDVMNADIDGDGIKNGFDPQPFIKNAAMPGGSTPISLVRSSEIDYSLVYPPIVSTNRRGVTVHLAYLEVHHFEPEIELPIPPEPWWPPPPPPPSEEENESQLGSRFPRLNIASLRSFDGPFGLGWNSCYTSNLDVPPEPQILTDPVIFNTGKGFRIQFTPSGVPNEYITPLGYSFELKYDTTTDTFIIRYFSGQSLVFSATGRLNYFEDRLGLQTVFNYDYAGHLDSIVMPETKNIGGVDEHRIINIVNYITGRIQKLCFYEFFAEWFPPEELPQEYGFIYDEAGHLIARTMPNRIEDGPDVYSTYSYEYNEDNQLTKYFGPMGETIVEIEYAPPNSLPKVDSVITPNASIHFEITSSGLTRTTTTYSISNTASHTRVGEYTFDDNKRITRYDEITDQSTYTVQYEYDSHGHLARKVLPRGNEASFLWDTENPDWKCRNNLLMKILKTIPGGTEANITERWTYEPRFQFVKTYSSPRELEDGDSNDGDFTTEYFYDYEEGLNSIDYNGDGYTSMEFGNIVKIKLPTLSGYSPPKQSEIFYFHSADGKFSKVKGQLGTTTEIELGDWDYPIARISDKDGNACKTQLTYNWFGKLTKVIDPEWENWDPSGGQAPSWKCQYDEWNNPTLATAPAPHNTRVFYSYCLRGNLTRVDIENLDKDNQVVSGNPWFTSKISYDLDRNPTRFTHELSSSVALCTQYEYDGLGRWVSRISPGGKVSRQGFNERGFLISEVEAYGTPDQAETSYSHDLNGNIVSVTNPRGYTEIYSYDGFDRNVEVRNPQGGIRKTSYDLAGNKIATSLHLMPESPATSELINVFDEHNLRIEERRRFIEADSTDRGWVVRKWEYDERGNVTKAIDQLGNATYFYYDALGRLARIVDSCSNESAVDYNKNGLVQMLFSKETNQLNGTTEEYTYEFTYDVLGRRISSIWYNCDNSSIRTETRRSYDSRGNVVFAERIDGKATETEYDGLSRAIKTAKQIKAGSILEGDISVKTIYDEDGNIISRIDHDGNCTLFRYNARNELIEIVKPHGTIATIERDLNGNVVSRIDPNGNVITSIYDNMDRLTARFAQLGASVIGPTSEVFVWDSLGRLLTSSNGNHSCERRYNSLSVVEKEINGLNEEEDLEMNWKYDDKLNVIQFISPSSVKIGRLFDAIGRISEFEVNDSHVATFMYAGNGNLLAACSIGNGQALSIALDGYGDERRRDWGSSILDLTSIYNSDRLLKKVVHNHAEGAYTEVEMDSASRITCAKTNVDPTSLIAEVEERISLNSGNTRISSVRIDESGCISTEYVSNENGQYTRIAGDVLSYDSNGNLIGDSKYCYFYSFKNQLVMVKQVSDNKVIGEYEYDTIGRRVLRTFWDDEKGRYESRRYVYDGWRLIEQYRDVGNGFSIFATYAFGQELDHIVSMSIRDINDVDEDEDITEMVTYYFHQDQMFNVHCLTDSIGRVVERYEYTPFGEMRLFISAGDDGSWYTDDDVCDISGRSRIYNSMHFKGRELDQETGFYYFRYRNYSASHGMFIQVDPLEFSQFIRNNGNSYAFPYCNPFSISDPFGTGPTSVVVSPVAPSIDPDSMEGDPNAVYVPTWARYNNPKAVKVYSDRGRVKRAEERSRNEISSRSIVRVIAIDSNPTPTKVLGVDAGKCWPALALRLARFQTRHSANIRTVVVSAKSLPAAWEAISNAVPAGSKLYEIQLWAHGTKGLIWWGGKSYSFEVFLRKNRTPALSRIIKLMEGGNCVKFRCCEYFLGKGGEKAAETAANCFKIKVWGTEGYDYGIITFYGRELLPGQRAGDTWPVGPERLEDRWYGFLRFGDLVAALGR